MRAEVTPAARTRFIESFDSIRFAARDDAERHRRILQAEAELFTSLLYGDRMIVSEAIGFDSAGFLDIAERVLRARDAFTEEGYHLRNCIVANPFELAWRRGWIETRRPARSYASFHEMVAYHFLLTPRDFQLSAWPWIDGSERARSALAHHVVRGTSGSMGDERREIVRIATDAAQGGESAVAEALDTRLRQLSRLHDYFLTVVPSAARSAPLSIEMFARALMDWSQGPATVERWGASADLVAGVPDHIRTLLSQQDENGRSVLFDARTWFHTQDFEQVADAYLLDASVLKLIAEFVDGAYNRVVSASINAGAQTCSTKGSAQDPAIRLAEELTTTVGQVLEPPSPRLWLHDFRIHAPDERAAADYDSIDRQELWLGFWRIVWDERWQESVRELQDARAGTLARHIPNRAAADDRFRHAFEGHTSLLEAALRRELGQNSGLIQLLEGGRFGTVFSMVMRGMPIVITNLLLSPSVTELMEGQFQFGGGFAEGLAIDAAIEIARRAMPRRLEPSVPISIGTRSVRPLAAFGLAG